MLQMPFPRIRLKAPVAPGENLRKNLNPPRFVTRTPPLNEPLGVKPADRESAPLQPKPGEKARISKGVSQGAVITRVTPIYPSTAKQMNAFGEVRVEITIDESGRVIEARALSGHPTLRGAAEEAARKWVFKPTLLDGTPVKQSGVLTFVFARPQ
jgi:protein TonB